MLQTLKKRLKCVSERPQKRNETEAELVASQSCSQSASQFSHFCCFSPLASTVVGLSGFPLCCPLRSSLFHASLRRVARCRWCSLSHGFRLQLKKRTTWLSLCVGINYQRRTVRVTLSLPCSSFDLSQKVRPGRPAVRKTRVSQACASGLRMCCVIIVNLLSLGFSRALAR